MEVLSHISTDGTFDQERPLLKLRRRKKNECYSFDLKSATGRWPLSVMYSLMSCMFGSTFASSIDNSSLGLNTFMVGKPITKRMYEIAFLYGQPLGYYGSWSLFSLSHHYIVWLAAKKAYPHLNRPFKDYALLGDDILITDKQVALQYRKLLDRLDVTISDAKSIVSDTGAVETTLGLCTVSNKYPIGISILQRLGGAGFRVRSRLYSTQSKRWEILKASAQKPNRSHPLPLAYWIGRRKPLNPYLKGKIVNFLRKELKPKEIRLFPEEMVFDKERDILEHTIIHNWVKMWLKWCSCTTWRRSTKDLDMIKFGLIWKCYDMGAGWDLTTTPRGNALQSEVLRLREEMFLVDAGLGTPRICMQDEPTGVPINRATREGNIACHKSEARVGTLLREGHLASRAFKDEAFRRSQVNFGPSNPAIDEKALWSKGKHVCYHTPYLPKVPRGWARAAKRRSGSGFPTGRGTGDGHLKAHHDLQAIPARPGKANRLGVRGSMYLQPPGLHIHHFGKRGEGISFLQRKKKEADLTRHNLTIHPIPMIYA
ncbi:hypothetical protein BC332_09707 [Capsicum chinense]|nr:hypothetical protein BC332_09707 [Capsicum chinense]